MKSLGSFFAGFGLRLGLRWVLRTDVDSIKPEENKVRKTSSPLQFPSCQQHQRHVQLRLCSRGRVESEVRHTLTVFYPSHPLRACFCGEGATTVCVWIGITSSLWSIICFLSSAIQIRLRGSADSSTAWLTSQACTDLGNASLRDFSKLCCGLPHNAFIAGRHTCLCPTLWIDRGWFYTWNMSHACLFKKQSGVLADQKLTRNQTCQISIP